MRKAFCSVNKFLRLDRLSSKFSFCRFSIKLVFDYLLGRFGRIRIAEFKSQPFEEVNSVPKGSSLGTLFFAAFIDDLPDLLTKSVEIGFKFYADDLALHTAETPIEVITARLNEALAIIQDWSLKNLISINTSKTEAMFFQKKKELIQVSSIRIGGDTIKIVDRFKYLGLNIDSQLNFKLHFKHVQSKLAQAMCNIRRISKFLTPRIFSIVVKAYIFHIFDFCIHIWAVKTPIELSTLQAPITQLLPGYQSPSLHRKLRRKKMVPSIRKSMEINPNSLPTGLNMLTISVRADWTRAKSLLSYSRYNLPELSTFYRFSTRPGNFPFIPGIACRSETLRRSVKFKSIQFWYTLPKEWIWNDLTTSHLKKYIHLRLVSNCV